MKKIIFLILLSTTFITVYSQNKLVEFYKFQDTVETEIRAWRAEVQRKLVLCYMLTEKNDTIKYSIDTTCVGLNDIVVKNLSNGNSERLQFMLFWNFHFYDPILEALIRPHTEIFHSKRFFFK